MVGAHVLGQDFRFFDFGHQLPAGEEVVYPPSDVALARERKMTPPRVVPVAFGEKPEGIHKSGLDYLIDTFSLFLGETFFALIGFWVAKSSGLCATLRSPQKTTGFSFSNSLQ